MKNTFNELGLTKPLIKSAEKLLYTEPTPIQEQVIPQALQGKDILASAQTGTGKTAAFLFPIFDKLVSFYGSRRPKGKNGPYALILSPTRELATQIYETAQVIGEVTNFRVRKVIGGNKYKTQIAQLEKGCDVLIATPGRLVDLLNKNILKLNNIHYLVLDEVDRMLDMGFWPSVSEILSKTNSKKQIFFLSATLSPLVLEKAKTLQHEPARIEISQLGETAESIEEYVLPVSLVQKKQLLCSLIKEKNIKRAIIFTHTKIEADSVSKVLQSEGIANESIHADKPQRKREKILKQFKEGKLPILVATDVLARGIDINDVSAVINYDIPTTPEDYVHRIGRTGRAGESGTAYSLLSPDQFLDFRNIEYFTKTLLQEITIESFAYDNERIPLDPKRPTKKIAKRNTSRRLSFRR